MIPRAVATTFRIALVGVVMSAMGASTAFAHPLVERGIERYEGADFQGALDAFDRAEAADDLTRDDVVALLEGRALVHLALGSEDDMEAALVQLASLEPDREMGRAVPPPMREAFSRIGAQVDRPLSLVTRAGSMPGGIRISTEIIGDSGRLVREVRIRARAASGAWVTGGSTFDVVASSGESVAYYAVAIGPGGAVLAERGTESAPLTAGGDISDDGDGNVLLDDDDGGGVSIPILIGIGAVVVVAAVVIAIILATSGGVSEETQLSPPMRMP